MSSSPESGLARPAAAARAALLGLLLACAGSAALAQGVLPGIGRPATPREIAAWDIDVRPDFKGLPKGSGSVAQGQGIWESQCASCHGVFGESNEVFSPLVGGTTADDVKTGRVARLLDAAYPGRTTLMKVATVSTLWDYIHRAMPWAQPKSLKPDEVYAVTAYLLNLGGILPDNFVLSDRTMAEAQARLPNRAGMRADHALWPGRGLGKATAPDVKAVACMKHCEAEPSVASLLPEHARNSHGNLAEQNRAVGAQHGLDTTRPASAAHAPALAGAAAATPPAAPANPGKPVAGANGENAVVIALLGKHSCVACHGIDNKLVGPSFKAVAGKHAGRSDAQAYLAGKIREGSRGVWGQMPMPPQALGDDDAKAIARWLIDGARK